MDHILRRARTRGLQSGCFQLCGSQLHRKGLIKGWTYTGEAKVESVQHPSKPRKNTRKPMSDLNVPSTIGDHQEKSASIAGGTCTTFIMAEFSLNIPIIFRKKKKKVKYTVQVLWRKKLCYRSYLCDATVSFISNTFGYWDVTFFIFFVLH